MNKLKIIIIALLLLIPSLARAFDDIKDDNIKLEKSEESPLGDIVVEHYENYKADDYHFKEIWLGSKKDPKNKFLIYSHGRSAEVIFSPDEKWLIINDYLGSNASDVILFRQDNDSKYTEVKNADVFNKAWALFFKQSKFLKPKEFGHQYAEAVRWASDSKSFLVSVWGHLDEPVKRKFISIAPWICVFEVNSMKVSLNFGLMNRNVIHKD
ncbi:MAG: hypothetical protein HGA69_00435 [Desulfobulbaceae bacterium]|nr:hypothetical protein [Desulfobulbaceae bacterium]